MQNEDLDLFFFGVVFSFSVNCVWLCSLFFFWKLCIDFVDIIRVYLFILCGHVVYILWTLCFDFVYFIFWFYVGNGLLCRSLICLCCLVGRSIVWMIYMIYSLRVQFLGYRIILKKFLLQVPHYVTYTPGLIF